MSLPSGEANSLFDTSNVRIPTRQEIRAVVMRHHEEMLAAARRGLNIHQVGIDQNDKILAYSRLLGSVHGPDAAVAFLNMHTQEVEAATAHTRARTAQTNARTQQLLAQKAANEASAEAVGRAIGGVILFLLLLWLFTSISSH